MDAISRLSARRDGTVARARQARQSSPPPHHGRHTRCYSPFRHR